MSLYFPREFETTVKGQNGEVYISQIDDDGVEAIIVLSVHQFREIWNREKAIVREALSESEVDEA